MRTEAGRVGEGWKRGKALPEEVKLRACIMKAPIDFAMQPETLARTRRDVGAAHGVLLPRP